MDKTTSRESTDSGRAPAGRPPARERGIGSSATRKDDFKGIEVLAGIPPESAGQAAARRGDTALRESSFWPGSRQRARDRRRRDAGRLL